MCVILLLIRSRDDFRNTTVCRVFDEDQCVPSYVYHHSISLTNDISTFTVTYGCSYVLARNIVAYYTCMLGELLMY